MRKSEIVRALWANYRASGLTVVYAAVAGILIGKNGLYYPLAWAVIAFAAFVSLIDSALPEFVSGNVSPLVQTSDLHSAKAKQINAIQTPTPNAERHSARATKESN